MLAFAGTASDDTLYFFRTHKCIHASDTNSAQLRPKDVELNRTVSVELIPEQLAWHDQHTRDIRGRPSPRTRKARRATPQSTPRLWKSFSPKSGKAPAKRHRNTKTRKNQRQKSVAGLYSLTRCKSRGRVFEPLQWSAHWWHIGGVPHSPIDGV